ncbi:Uncharacterised protein [Mycobacterium tuberculosis]|nr:Uncharacterised protein [Mycobacterium tuberculosis]
MPAGAALAERGVPAGLAGAARHPQQRVEGVALARAERVAAALGEQRGHLLAAEAADRAEGRVGGDREVDVAVDLVGGVAAAELLDHLDDERDRLDRADVAVGRQDPQRGHVLAEQLDLAVGEGAPVLAGLLGAFQEGVVDVGGVLHVVDAVAEVAPHAVDEVEREVGVGVAEVGGVVGGDAAHVHPGGLAGGGGPRGARPGVVKGQRTVGGGQARVGQAGYFGGGPRSHTESLSMRS